MSDRPLSQSIRRYADRREVLTTPDVPFTRLDYWADRAAALEAEVGELRERLDAGRNELEGRGAMGVVSERNGLRAQVIRDYDVEVCDEDCGQTVFVDGLWTTRFETGGGGVGFGRVYHCPYCGTRVGATMAGRSWRQRMVPEYRFEEMRRRRDR